MKLAGIATFAAFALSAQALTAQQPGPPEGMAERMRIVDSTNARLDTLVNRMNRATGTRKVTAMADVINQLVADRRAMQARIHQMMESPHGLREMMGTPDTVAKSPGSPAPVGTDTSRGGYHPPN